MGFCRPSNISLKICVIVQRMLITVPNDTNWEGLWLFWKTGLQFKVVQAAGITWRKVCSSRKADSRSRATAGKKQLSKKKVGSQGLSSRSVSQAIERKVSPSHQCHSVASNRVGAEKYDFQDMESSPSVLCNTGKASATSLWGHCSLCNVQHSSKSSGRKTEEI